MSRWYWIASVVPAIAALYYVVVLGVLFRQFPSQMAIHFALDGTPNGWLNRYAWAALSLVVLGLMISMVFTTKPIAGDGAITSWMYWTAFGLVIGSFVEVNRAAAGHHNLRMWPLAIWSLAIPLLEFLLVKAAGSWLRG